MKKCSVCGEMININTRVCPFCGDENNGTLIPDYVPQPEREPSPPKEAVPIPGYNEPKKEK